MAWNAESKRHSIARKYGHTGSMFGEGFAKVHSSGESRVLTQERRDELNDMFFDIRAGEDVMTPQDARDFILMHGNKVPNLAGMSYEKKAAWLIVELKALSNEKHFFARRGDKFDGSKNILIWTGVEEPWRDGLPFADYYNDYSAEIFNKKFRVFLKKHNLNFEWNDPGTIMIYPDNSTRGVV